MPGVPVIGGAAVAVAPAAPVLRVATYHDVVEHLRYSDLVRTDCDTITIVELEYVLHRRITAAHRQPDSDCRKGWRDLIKAINDKTPGCLVGLTDEDPAIVVAEALRAAQRQPAFIAAHGRVAERRRDFCRALRLGGVLDVAMITELLPSALQSGAFDRTQSFLQGITVPSQLSALIEEMAAVLKAPEAQFGEAMMRSVERILQAGGVQPEGGTAAARIAHLQQTLTTQELAKKTAPKSEGAENASGVAQLASHTQAQADALFAVYQTANFREQGSVHSRESRRDMGCQLGARRLDRSTSSSAAGSAHGPRVGQRSRGFGFCAWVVVGLAADRVERVVECLVNMNQQHEQHVEKMLHCMIMLK